MHRPSRARAFGLRCLLGAALIVGVAVPLAGSVASIGASVPSTSTVTPPPGRRAAVSPALTATPNPLPVPRQAPGSPARAADPSSPAAIPAGRIADVPAPLPTPRSVPGAPDALPVPAPIPRMSPVPTPTLPAPTVPPPTDQWPMYLHDPARSGESLVTTLSPAAVAGFVPLGAVQTGDVIAAQAAIVNGTVYVGSWDGNLYALDAQTGATQWAAYLGRTQSACGAAGISSVATVENGTVYVGGGSRYFYALDAASGAVKWQIDTGNTDATDPDGGHYNWSSPLIVGNDVYIGIASFGDCPLVQGKLLRVDKQSGALVGEFDTVNADQTGGSIWTSPCYDARTRSVLFTTGNGDPDEPYAQAIVALGADAFDFRGAWRIPDDQAVFDSDWGTSCVVDATSGLVFASNKNGILYAFDPANVAAGPVWETQIANGGESPEAGDGSVSTPAVANGIVYAAGGITTIAGQTCRSGVRAFDAASGETLWEYCGSDVILGAVTYVDGVLFVGDGATLEALDTTNSGALLLSIPTGGLIYAPASVVNGEVYFGSTDGREYVIGGATSPVQWAAVPQPQRAKKPLRPRLYPKHR